MLSFSPDSTNPLFLFLRGLLRGIQSNVAEQVKYIASYPASQLLFPEVESASKSVCRTG